MLFCVCIPSFTHYKSFIAPNPPFPTLCVRMMLTVQCVVPGSGFQQVPGTFHFRTTFLPPVNVFDSYIEKFTVKALVFIHICDLVVAIRFCTLFLMDAELSQGLPGKIC